MNLVLLVKLAGELEPVSGAVLIMAKDGNGIVQAQLTVRSSRDMRVIVGA